MKILTTIFAACMMCIMYSCQPKGEPCPEIPTKHANGIFAATKNDTISRDTFNVWKARWENNYRSFMATDSIEYFDIPLLDLSSILQKPNVAGARMYMGMAIENGKKIPHTMIVGRRKNGSSVMSQILDYSSLCPRNCPDRHVK